MLLVRALAIALLLPASGWTAALVLGGAGPALPGLRARTLSLPRRDHDRRVVLAAHRSDRGLDRNETDTL
jgi:hypothetical protein